MSKDDEPNELPPLSIEDIQKRMKAFHRRGLAEHHAEQFHQVAIEIENLEGLLQESVELMPDDPVPYQLAYTVVAGTKRLIFLQQMLTMDLVGQLSRRIEKLERGAAGG